MSRVSLILCIESTTKNCSAGVARDGVLIALREDSSEKYTHAEKLNVFIDEAMREADAKFADLDAVAVSKGPGSYTGLRIGVSAAKGIAYAAGIPIIAVCPLRAMAAQVGVEEAESTLLIPMIDARRMEVFCAGFNGCGAPIFDTRAEILSEESFREARSFKRILYFGDGAEKCEPLLGERKGFEFLPDVHASVKGMAALAADAFAAKAFEDTAYFEPFYLKDFVAGKPKKQK